MNRSSLLLPTPVRGDAESARRRLRKRAASAIVAFGVVAAGLVGSGGTANAAIVATVPMGTTAEYAVLGASTVTNTGATVLDGSLGLWPGPSITGFPPGIVLPPGTTNATNAAAQQAQSDLTIAYNNAAGRPVDGTTTADLANLNLSPGVYSGPDKSALLLNGPLTLDGGGNAAAVFIFQTDSTLTTGSNSTVNLVNGAQECNIFWQVGSSATLGTNSVMVGNILALTSITVDTNVTVHGRALARNGAVTLDDDTFVRPSCDTTNATTTTTTSTTNPGATTVTSSLPGSTLPASTTLPGGTTTTPGATSTQPDDSPGPGPVPTVPGTPGDDVPGGGTTTSTTAVGGPGGPGGPNAPGGPGGPNITQELARTGVPLGALAAVAALVMLFGAAALRISRSRTT